MENINVLSLFDGMSCGQQALDRVGISVNKYYASEVDKHAIIVTQANYPNTMQLGDVRNIHYTNAGIEVDLGPSHVRFIETDIQLLIGGSPCQSFSFSGKRKGMTTKCSVEIISLEQYLELKAAGFEFEGQSYLFWEYVRILRTANPKYFILENVASMSQEAKQEITKTLGVEPIMINASLVSAQQRKRLFWANIPNVTQPIDRGILLKDILIDGIAERDKSLVITATYSSACPRDYFTKSSRQPVKVGHFNKGGQGDRVYSIEGKSVTLSALGGVRGAKTGLYVVPVALRNRGNGKQPEYNNTGKANALTTVQTDSMVEENFIIRKLHPIECERLQGLPDNYTDGISHAQRYKCLENAFNVDVVAHILSFIPKI